MPCLKERPIEERYVIIRTFLGREARQIRRQLVVEWPVVAALLTYPCSGNVGQLRSDIQVLCAEAFLASVSMGRPKVRIKAEQLKGALEDSCGSSGAVSARIPGFGRDLTITPEGGSDEDVYKRQVVTTIMSNFGLYKAFDREGISYEKTAVGDKYVYENMANTGNCLGGEQSGHIIFSKHATTCLLYTSFPVN